MMTGPHAMLSKYRLLARLGSGGMAEVFLVLSEGPGGFNKLQVLKLMRSDLTDQERPDFLQMFQDEARLAARLNHPHIVQSHEVGAEDGQPFIVMEFLEGQPLHRVQQRSLHKGGGFKLDYELFALCQVLEGLEYAHRLTDYDGTPLNIVHRDVSPQNVFVTYTGQTKLVDFGVAKTLESSKTRAGVVKGKVAYMPPEQVTGGPIDHRADLFSVGVLLWEAIAKQSMHADLSVYESLNRLVRGDLPKIRDIAPDVPRELERIVTRALALAPEQRYPDAEQFRHDLLTYLESVSKVRAKDVGECVAQLFARERAELSQVIRNAMTSNPGRDAAVEQGVHVTRRVPLVGATRSEPEAPKTLETPTTRDSKPLQIHEPRGRRKPGWWGLGLTLALLVGGGTVVALRSGNAGSAPPASTSSGAGTAPTSPDVPAPSPVHTTAPSDGERAEPAVRDVQVDIAVAPDEASILLDGRVLGRSPYRAREPRDDRDHTLVVTAPGFLPLSRLVRFDRDVSLDLKLEAAPRAATEVTDAPAAASSSPVRTRSAHPTRSATAREKSAPSLRTSEQESEPYIDLPAPRRRKRTAPELDKSDPWEPERPR